MKANYLALKKGTGFFKRETFILQAFFCGGDTFQHVFGRVVTTRSKFFLSAMTQNKAHVSNSTWTWLEF